MLGELNTKPGVNYMARIVHGKPRGLHHGDHGDGHGDGHGGDDHSGGYGSDHGHDHGSGSDKLSFHNINIHFNLYFHSIVHT